MDLRPRKASVDHRSTNDFVGWPKLTEGVTDEKNLKNEALGSYNRGEASINLQSSKGPEIKYNRHVSLCFLSLIHRILSCVHPKVAYVVFGWFLGRLRF